MLSGCTLIQRNLADGKALIVLDQLENGRVDRTTDAASLLAGIPGPDGSRTLSAVFDLDQPLDNTGGKWASPCVLSPTGDQRNSAGFWVSNATLRSLEA